MVSVVSTMSSPACRDSKCKLLVIDVRLAMIVTCIHDRAFALFKKYPADAIPLSSMRPFCDEENFPVTRYTQKVFAWMRPTPLLVSTRKRDHWNSEREVAPLEAPKTSRRRKSYSTRSPAGLSGMQAIIIAGLVCMGVPGFILKPLRALIMGHERHRWASRTSDVKQLSSQ